MQKLIVVTVVAAGVSLLSGCSDVNVDTPTGPSAIPTTFQFDASSDAATTETQSRPVAGFTEVSLTGAARLFIEQTGTESLTVEAEAHVMPHVTSEVRDGRLILTTVGEFSTDRFIEYRLTVRDLSAISVSGVAHAEATRLDTDFLRVHVEGMARLTASGRADRQQVSVIGLSRYEAGELSSRDVRIEATGSGSALVRVSERLDATVSGFGRVEYIGNPIVTTHIAGSGTVRPASS
jgi:hypothetical protein